MADWDSTVIPRHGKQEDTAIGYNPQKPGSPSHHPLACVIGGTRLCLHMEWRKCNTVSANGWSCERRVIVERTLKPLNASPQGSFWRQCKEDFSAYVTNLTPEEADVFQIVQLYHQRADAENVFDEL